MSIRKGVIIAAGYGTRFLPITKTVPKELLPIGNRPALDWIIAEFTQVGITDILIVISPHKRLIARHYRPDRHLERRLQRAGHAALLPRLAAPPVTIRFALQRQMRGTGHALLCARRFVGDDAVIVAYPDDLHVGSPPLSQQLIDLFHARGTAVMAAMEITCDHQRYGILDIDAPRQLVRGIVEKPAANAAPSNYASIGRFLFTPEFFAYVAAGWQAFDRAAHAEYYHVYALNRLIAQERLMYCLMSGRHLDIGTPAGYAQAIAHHGA